MKKVFAPKQFKDDEQFYFYFNEQGEARQLNFEDDNGHEVDDTTYIEASDEIYINGLYFKKCDCVEVREA